MTYNSLLKLPLAYFLPCNRSFPLWVGRRWHVSRGKRRSPNELEELQLYRNNKQPWMTVQQGDCMLNASSSEGSSAASDRREDAGKVRGNGSVGAWGREFLLRSNGTNRPLPLRCDCRDLPPPLTLEVFPEYYVYGNTSLAVSFHAGPGRILTWQTSFSASCRTAPRIRA